MGLTPDLAEGAELDAAFRDLQRIGPQEVQDDLRLFIDAAESGGESLFLEDNPLLQAASDHFIRFVLAECGYALDANN